MAGIAARNPSRPSYFGADIFTDGQCFVFVCLAVPFTSSLRNVTHVPFFQQMKTTWIPFIFCCFQSLSPLASSGGGS
jgi:hypothetical protein